MPGSLFRSAYTRPDVTCEQVLAFHRGVFGDARMDATDDQPDGADAGGDGKDADNAGDAGGAQKTLEEIVADLGLTPGQIAGRLEASRKWEQRAKARADYDDVKAELDRIKQQNESETEKAIREAKEAGKAEATAAATQATVKAMLRMGLRAHGIKDDDLDEIVSTINLSAHADEQGLVDDEKVLRTINRLAGTAGGTAGPDTGQGNRGRQTAKSGVSAGAEMFAAARGKKTES